MANISYPKFGKVKTIVLPIPTSSMSLEEYKDFCGIDLEEFLIIESDTPYLKFPKNALVLIADTFDVSSSFVKLNNVILTEEQAYDSGADDGYFGILGLYNNDEQKYEGLELFIDKDEEFSIENIKVISVTY